MFFHVFETCFFRECFLCFLHFRQPWSSLIKSETFFHNTKLTSITIVFCLNKTFFMHSDYNYVRINCFFVTQNSRKLLSSLSRMRDFIDKNSVNKFVSQFLSVTRGKFKIEGFWVVFKSFCYTIFTNLQKNL